MVVSTEPKSVAPETAALAQVRQVHVRAVAFEAERTNSFELVDPSGGELPPFSAGAHIDVHLPDGLVRQYSLCNDPAERRRYVIAVLREETGRGGSRAMHEAVRAGELLTIAGPRNNFPLAEGARHHLLIAGGIGVTPMMAMAASLETRGADWHMHYCTRSRERTAFLDRLAPFISTGKVSVHHDGGDPSKGLDLARLLRAPAPATHLYYCGPPPFMEAAKVASAHWDKGTVHFEHFSAPADRPKPATDNRPFRVRLARRDIEFEVPADKTIVQVLREHDIFIETSCEEGFCGTCLTRYCAGEPEHRDSVLDESDRKEFVLICCARSKTPLLTLDI